MNILIQYEFNDSIITREITKLTYLAFVPLHMNMNGLWGYSVRLDFDMPEELQEDFLKRYLPSLRFNSLMVKLKFGDYSIPVEIHGGNRGKHPCFFGYISPEHLGFAVDTSYLQNSPLGSSFDDYLKEEGLLEEAENKAREIIKDKENKK